MVIPIYVINMFPIFCMLCCTYRIALHYTGKVYMVHVYTLDYDWYLFGIVHSVKHNTLCTRCIPTV